NGFGTVDERYKLAGANQKHSPTPRKTVEFVFASKKVTPAGASMQKFRSAAADLGGDRARYPSFESVGRAGRRRRKRLASCARQIFAAVSLAGNRGRRRRTVFRSASNRARALGRENLWDRRSRRRHQLAVALARSRANRRREARHSVHSSVSLRRRRRFPIVDRIRC